MDQICKDIRDALPKKINASSIGKVRESLHTCQIALRGTHSDEECFTLLKTGIMYLIKIMRLRVSSEPVKHDGDDVLNVILECLLEASDHGVKSSSFVASLITDVCLDIVFSDKFAFLSRIEVLNKLNIVYESTDTSLKEKLLQTEFLKSNLSKLFQLVLDSGDYEFQVCMMEFLFRLIPRKLRSKHSTTLIKDQETRQAFLATRDSHFEVDCRNFLNQLNSNQDMNRKVFSYPCHSITLGTLELQKPSDVGYDEFWLDINMSSKRIIIFCENELLSSQMNFPDDCWNAVYIWEADIERCVCQEEQDQLHVKLYIKSTAACIPHQHVDDSSPILHIVTNLQHDLKTVLWRFLDEKFDEAVNNSTQEKEDGSFSLANKSKEAHSSVETASQLVEKQRKTSVPSDPMVTPASFVSLESFFSQATRPEGKFGLGSLEIKMTPAQTTQPKKKSEGSQSALRRSSRLKSKSASPSCDVSRRRTRSSSGTADIREKQDNEEHDSQMAVIPDLLPVSSDKESKPKRKAGNKPTNEKSKPVREEHVQVSSGIPDTKKLQGSRSSDRSTRSRKVSEEESCGILCSSKKQTETSQSLVKTEKSLFQGKSEKAIMKQSNRQLTVSRENNSVNSFTDEEKLKQFQIDQKASRCARYVLRDCSNRQDRSRVSSPIFCKVKGSEMVTVSDHNIDNEVLTRGMTISLKEQASNTESEKQARTKTSKEKSGKNPVNSQMPQHMEVGRKNNIKSDFSLTSNRSLERLELSVTTRARPEHLVEKLREKKTSTCGVSTVNQQAFDGSSFQHRPVRERSSQHKRDVISQLAPITSGTSHFADKTSRSHPSVFDDDDNDDDYLNTSFVVETDVKRNDTQKRNCSQSLNGNFSTTENTPSDEHERTIRSELENSNKKDKCFGVKEHQQNKTPVNLTKVSNLKGRQSSSSKRNASWKQPLFVTHQYGNDEVSDIANLCQDTSAENLQKMKYESVEKDKCKNLQSMQDESIEKDRQVDRSPAGSRTPECLDAAICNPKKKLKQKHLAVGADSKLIDFRVTGMTAKVVSNDHSVYLNRKLRQKQPVSYKESSESSDLEQDTELHSFAGQSESPEMAKLTSKSMPRSSVRENTLSKWKLGNDDSEKRLHAKRTDSSEKYACSGVRRGKSDIYSLSAGSQSSHISPVKFCMTDPRSSTSDDELFLSQQKTKKNTTRLSTSSARENTFAYRRETLSVGLDKRNEPNDLRSRKPSSVQSYADSLDTGPVVDAKSELSWIVAYKSQNKPNQTKTYERYPVKPYSPTMKDTFGPEFALNKVYFASQTTVTLKRGPKQTSQEFDSPLILSDEKTPDIHCQTGQDSDIDWRTSERSKGSLKLAQTPGTSVCGSAFSELSLLSDFSHRLTSVQTDTNKTDAERRLQIAEESSPSPSVDSVGDGDGKITHVEGPRKANKKQQPVCHRDEMRQLKKEGLISGPSSVVRPSTPELKRKLCNKESSSSTSSLEDGIPETKQLCLRPRVLFPDAHVDFADSRGDKSKDKRKSLGIDKNISGENTTVSRQCIMESMSEVSEEEDSDYAQLQHETEFGGKQPAMCLTSLVRGFGFDLQKHIKAREHQVQQLADGALELSNKRASQLWTEDRKQWDQLVCEFQDHINTELRGLEEEVLDLSKVQKKTETVYLEQLKLLRAKREKLQKGVEAARNCYENFKGKSHRTPGQTLQVQRELETHMKQDMDRLKNRMLLDMQRQQLRRLKESIQKHLV